MWSTPIQHNYDSGILYDGHQRHTYVILEILTGSMPSGIAFGSACNIIGSLEGVVNTDNGGTRSIDSRYFQNARSRHVD